MDILITLVVVIRPKLSQEQLIFSNVITLSKKYSRFWHTVHSSFSLFYLGKK